jgi:hypothetical protein
MELTDFISNKKYLESFALLSPKAYYLFGDIDFEDLQTQHKIFLNDLGKNPPTESGSGGTSDQWTGIDSQDQGYDNSPRHIEDVL